VIYYPQAYYHNYLWIYPGPEQNDFQIQIVMKFIRLLNQCIINYHKFLLK